LRFLNGGGRSSACRKTNKGIKLFMTLNWNASQPIRQVYYDKIADISFIIRKERGKTMQAD